MRPRRARLEARKPFRKSKARSSQCAHRQKTMVRSTAMRSLPPRALSGWSWSSHCRASTSTFFTATEMHDPISDKKKPATQNVQRRRRKIRPGGCSSGDRATPSKRKREVHKRRIESAFCERSDQNVVSIPRTGRPQPESTSAFLNDAIEKCGKLPALWQTALRCALPA